MAELIAAYIVGAVSGGCMAFVAICLVMTTRD